MEISVKFEGLKELTKNMDDLAKRQVPYATAKALTKTAQDIKAEELREVQRTIDRPTPYAINSLRVDPATKNKLEATVRFKDKSDAGKGNPAANFMLPQAEGGKRNIKRFESALQRIGVLPQGMYIVPGEACPLDAYGNIPGSFIVQILSYFRAFGEQGYRANITDKRKAALAKGSKRKRTMGYEYFVSYGKGTWSGRQHLPAGIYKRVAFARGNAIKPIMMFVKEPTYQKRFPFYEIAQKTTKKNIVSNFNEAMDEAIKTAK
jgi:hypothetical protein